MKSPTSPGSFKVRVTALMVGCIVFAFAIAGRAAYIQVIRDPRLENMARRQFQSKVLIRPRRGLIRDRNNEPLAVNIEVKSLAANPGKVQNKRTLARLLSKATDVPYSRILGRLKENREFVWIKRHISENEMNRLKKFRVIDSDGDLAAGLWMVQEAKRVYPHGELASHVLGSVNLDSEGLEGMELWANEDLRGKVVSVRGIKDARGRPTFIDSVAAQDVKEGESLSLTIDSSLQFAVSQELKNAVNKANARGGSVIVMNAETGEILAMANEPSFNPNEKGVPASRRRNRVLTDGYEPGSTMKPVLLASALSRGMKLSDQLWGEHGSMVLQGRRISEAEAHEKFEWISLKKMIQVSSNVGAAKLALKVGADHYYSTLKSFGFGSKTGTGFPGEISGILPARKGWQPLTLANIGFGQGILVTPMQMLRAYATFANGGWLVQPTLLKSHFKGYKHEQPKRILTQKVADSVTEAMQTVTEDGGTAMKARVEGYVVAGKTGTAQMVDPATGRYSRSKYVASFIGYPVGIEPKLVIFTAIEEPRGVYYASETAAPLFHSVLTAAATRFSLPSKIDTASRVLAATQGPGGDLAAGRAKRGLSPNALKDRLQYSLAKVKSAEEVGEAPALRPEAGPNGTTWKMPSLEGLTPREAIHILKGHRFQLEVHGSGIVRTQSPDSGKSIAEGARIRLTLMEP